MRHGSTHRGSGSFLTFPVSGGALLNLVAFVPTDLDVEESWSAPGDVAALAAAYNGWAKLADASPADALPPPTVSSAPRLAVSSAPGAARAILVST